MIAYTTYTGTRSTKAQLQKAGWHWLMTPDVLSRNAWRRPIWNDGSPAPYALDNGAYSCYTKGLPFDPISFRKALAAVGSGASWVVVPDIVADGKASLAYSLSWLNELRSTFCLSLLPVQDGMTPEQVRPHLGPRVGIFIGGSTEWKLNTMGLWGRLAKEQACYLHVGRVNTARRIRLCQDYGADSIDGTSVIRFPSTLKLLNGAVNQMHLWGKL